MDRGSGQGANLSHLFGFVKGGKGLACLLLVIAETETRGRREGTSERRGIALLTPNSKHRSVKDNTNASDRVHRYDDSPISINSLHVYEASAASKTARAPALRELIC